MSTWRFLLFLDVLSTFIAFCGRLLVFYRDTALERVKRWMRKLGNNKIKQKNNAQILLPLDVG